MNLFSEQKIKKLKIANKELVEQNMQFEKYLTFIQTERYTYEFDNIFDSKLLEYLECCTREAKAFLRNSYRLFDYIVAHPNEDYDYQTLNSFIDTADCCLNLNEHTLNKLRTVKNAYNQSVNTGTTNREKLRRSLKEHIDNENKFQELLDDDLFEYRQENMLNALFDDEQQHVSPFSVASENLTCFVIE